MVIYLAINTLYNILGQVTPMLLAIWAIPELIAKLGIERFGLLTIAWSIIGYFSLFDFGLSRSLTQLVAGKIGMGKEDEIPAIVWSAVALMVALGIGGAIIASLVCPQLVQVLNISSGLQLEAREVFYLLALSIPIVITTAAFRGVLEAQQRFDLINIVRTAMGIFTFMGPLLVLPFSQSLSVIVVILIAGRLLFWVVHIFLCMYSMPALRLKVELKRAVLGPLIRFGGWMTISNIISPLMVYMDRFIIGALLTVAAVTYYTTPYEVVTKILVIPGALVSVLFPAFSMNFVRNLSRVAQLFEWGVKGVFIILFPVILAIIIFAFDGLRMWLGTDFAQHSALVLQWLGIGVFVNGLAGIPFALIQGAGRPDLTAKLHMIELPFYLLMIWWLIDSYGIEGAALAWMLRVTGDALLLFYLVKRIVMGSTVVFRSLGLIIGGGIGILLFFTLFIHYMLIDFMEKGLLYILVVIIFALLSWFLILLPEDRKLIRDQLSNGSKVIRKVYN